MSDENVEPPDSDTICPICYAEFLEPEDLTMHLTEVHVTEDRIDAHLAPCLFCKAVFTNITDNVFHLRDIHLLNLRACKYCTRIFTDKESLTAHERKHPVSKTKGTGCSQCNKQFEELYQLAKHEYKGHSRVKDGVMINDCLPYLSSILNMKALTFLEYLGNNSMFTCNKCSMSTSLPSEYIQHLQQKNCTSVVCNHCSNVYNEKRKLSRHLQVHKECWVDCTKANLVAECPDCHMVLNKLNLSRHAKKCQPIKCSICNITFQSMYELSGHQSKKHPMAVCMKTCMFCSREFVGSVALNKHVARAHKKDFHLYKYKCHECELFFSHPKRLFAHYFSTHKELEPFSCKICDKKFRVRKSFTLHIKLQHKSEGFVEFDENYHVFFAAEKSAEPFQPTSFFVDEDGDTEPEELPLDTGPLETTDVETDAERLAHKPPKMRFKKPVTESDVANSEVDKNKSELEGKPVVKNQLKRKKMTKKHNLNKTEDFSDDEPLIKLKRSRKSRISNNQRRFTCKICNKYCYTFLNYNRHMSTHSNEKKKCIKCDSVFKSNDVLQAHIAEKHSSSKLTETLKNVLQRRKSGKLLPPKLSLHQSFIKTIKKVPTEPSNVVAKLTQVADKLSVKNFIESFTPEEAKKPEIEISCNISVKLVDNPIKREPCIKLKKFTPPSENRDKFRKLAMPVRFKQVYTDRPKITVKIINNPILPSLRDASDDDADSQDPDYEPESYSHSRREEVPEMAQEVMLVEENPKIMNPMQKVVIPKLKETELKKIRIAHLLPEAPYFKIVKMEQVLEQAKQEEIVEEEDDVQLPDGTKLVHVNPLAHLIGNQSIDDIVGPAKVSKRKPKTKKSFENAIAKALLKLDKPVKRQSRAKKTQPQNTET